MLRSFQIVLIPCYKGTFPFTDSGFQIVHFFAGLLVDEGFPEIELLLLMGFLDSE
jgi:hypothetical protein